MGILPWSYGFLLIMSLLSWALLGRMSEEVLVTQSLLTVINGQADALADDITVKSTAAYNAERKRLGLDHEETDREDDEGASDQPRKRNYRSRQHLTSKLHVRAVFSNDEQDQRPTQEYIFRSLLRHLYGSIPLCTPRGDNDPYVQQIFDQVRAKALELEPIFPMHKAQYLANIELSGPHKNANQFGLFLMLKGGKGEVFPGAPCTVHSLLNYISMNRRQTCISVYLAPAAVLKAIFGDEDLVTEICRYRHEVSLAIRREDRKKAFSIPGEKDRDIVDILSDDFKAQFGSHLPGDIDPQFIDFRVSSTVPTDFPENKKQRRR
jgi:hypothetical protein